MTSIIPNGMGESREMPSVGGPPKVSVGMPVYNGERYLKEALDSILAQSFDNFELVISDNASTDSTEEICRTYVHKDERIRYFRMRENYGVIDNFNNVFRLSTGAYFKWASSDDVCEHEYLGKAVEVLDRDPSVVLVWARTLGIDEYGKAVPLQHEISDLNSAESVFSPDPTVRFRRLLRNIWWVDGPLYGVIRATALSQTRALHARHFNGDQILLTELSLKGRFYEIPDERFFSRVHPNKTSGRQKTLRDRVALVDQMDPGRGVRGWWRMLRGYPQRIALYMRYISDAPLSPGQRLLCRYEVLRAMASWGILRIRQVATGTSPWSRGSDH
jgi:glycosyltransferase involved in cell wall biosynthesis